MNLRLQPNVDERRGQEVAFKGHQGLLPDLAGERPAALQLSPGLLHSGRVFYPSASGRRGGSPCEVDGFVAGH